MKMSHNYSNGRLIQRCLAVAIIAVLVVLPSQLAFADFYKAKVAFEGQDDMYRASRTYPSDGIALGDDKLLFFGNVNQVEGLYSFDAKTETAQLLKQRPKFTAGSQPWTGRHQSVGGGLALLSVQGAVYATDGTPGGTKLIKDFGTYYCCSSYGYEVSYVTRIDYLNGRFYITSINYSQSPSSELWETDGTAAGTKLVSSGNYHIKSVFSANHNGAPVIHFVSEFSTATYDESAIMRLTAGQSATKLFTFPRNYLVGVSATNSTGTFICAGLSGPSPETQSGVYRLSNSGTVTRVADDCYPDSLAEHNDNIYYLSVNGIWFTDGHPGSSTLALSIDITNDNVFSARALCLPSDALRYLVPGGRLVEIDANGTRILSGPLSNEARLLGCLDNGALFRLRYFDTYDNVPSAAIYNGETKQFSLISGQFPHILSLGKSAGSPLGVLESKDGAVYAFGSIPTLDSHRLLKLYKSGVVAPAIMLLLDSDS